MAQYSTVQYNTVQYRAVQYDNILILYNVNTYFTKHTQQNLTMEMQSDLAVNMVAELIAGLQT